MLFYAYLSCQTDITLMSVQTDLMVHGTNIIVAKPCSLKNVKTQGFQWENLILLLNFYAYLNLFFN